MEQMEGGTMPKMRMATLFAFVLLMASTAVVSAETMGTPTEDLTYDITSDSVYARYTTSYPSSEVATVAFRLGFVEVVESDSIGVIEAAFVYQPSKLHWTAAFKDSTAWPGVFTYTIDSVNGLVTLHFEQARVPVPEELQTFAYISFHSKCLSTGWNNLGFTESDLANQVTLLGSASTWSPILVNRNPGGVYGIPHTAAFRIENDTASGSIGSDEWLSVFATTDFRTYAIVQDIVYDHLKLDYQEAATDLGWYDNMVDVTELNDSTLHITAHNAFNNGMSEFAGEEIYRLRFKLLCGSGPVNYVSPVRFDTSECIVMQEGCLNWEGAPPQYTNGALALQDHASLIAEQISAGPVSKYSTSSLRYLIKYTNSMVSGLKPSATSDTGLTINLDLKTNALGLAGSPYDGTDALFADLESNQYASLFQVHQSSPASANYWSAASSPTNLMYLNLLWDPSGYGTPTWANQYIKPAFVDSFPAAKSKTEMPDTIVCRSARVSNGLLTYGNFQDSILLMMGELSTTGYNSYTPCTYQNLNVRANFTIDSIRCRITITGNACITGISEVRTGVVATYVSNGVYDITTNSNFVPIPPADTVVKLLKISEGVKTANCQPMGKPNTLGVNFSQQALWDSQSDSQYVLIATSSARSRCPAGTGCCFSQPYGDLPDEPGVSKGDESSSIPRVFALDQNYPNPFNPVTTISLQLPVSCDWSITVYNIQGQTVKEFTGSSGPGIVQVRWDGSQSASGVYFYRAIAGDFVAQRKMMLLK
jgi:hypothetical protein